MPLFQVKVSTLASGRLILDRRAVDILRDIGFPAGLFPSRTIRAFRLILDLPANTAREPKVTAFSRNPDVPFEPRFNRDPYSALGRRDGASRG